MRWLALVVLQLAALPALAHELRPAYLELREDGPGEFHVLWKTPMRGELRLALEPAFSGRAERLGEAISRRTGAAALQTWRVRMLDPLRGQTLSIDGLDATMTDALVRIEFADDSVWTQRLTPQAPAARIPERQTRLAVAGVYTALGIEHIVFGADHLLFVFGLLLLVDERWALLRTITAFTLAHSLTLALAALGWVAAPVAPLEAAIALSILFLGPEIVRKWHGRTSLTRRRPWIVAFCFGLLHGFGFAGAMTSAGLPRAELPLALVTFNVGVELGQVGFVAVVLLAARAFRRLDLAWPAWVERAPGYAVGSLGAFWTIQRTAMMLGVS